MLLIESVQLLSITRSKSTLKMRSGIVVMHKAYKNHFKTDKIIRKKVFFSYFSIHSLHVL